MSSPVISEPTAEPNLPPLPTLRNPEKRKDLVSTKLGDSNFRAWKNNMEAEFEYYGIDGIINGMYSPPVEQTKRQYWLEIEQLFKWKFSSTIPARVYEKIKTKTSLRERWQAILHHYTLPDLGKMTDEMFSMKLGPKEKVEDFAIRMQDLWESIERCGQSTTQAFKVEQFMSKMEPVFPTETRELRRSRDIRSLTWDYIVRTYREVEHTRPTAAASTGAALTVNPGPIRKAKSYQSLRDQPYDNPKNYNNPRNFNNHRGRGRGHPFGRGRGRGRSHSQNRNQNPNADNPPRKRFCFACHKEGHLIRECPDLQGFREYCQKKDQNQSKNHTGTNFSGAAFHSEENTESEYMGHILMADTGSIANDDWVFDTGACVPMTKLKESFIDYTPFRTPVSFSAANGGPLAAHGIGTVRIPTEYGHIDVPNMYYVPNVTANLVSAYRLRRVGYNVEQGPEFSFRLTDRDGNLVAVATPANGVYIIHSAKRPVYTVTTPDPLYQWHLRLGHVHYEAVSKVTGIPMKRNFPFPPCHPCLAGKQTRSRCTEPQRRASRPLELVHMDLGGYYDRSIEGFRYFLIIVDDYSRFTWIWLLKSKDKEAVSAAVRQFKAHAENQFECKIKRARTDNGGGEFKNKEWEEIVVDAGIQHEPSPPYEHDRNGVAERAIRTIKEMATSMLVQAGLPPSYWPDAVATASYLRNRLPTKASLTGLTPIATIYPAEKEDQYSHLKPFGCLCYAAVPKEMRRSFTSKTRVCLFLGYVWNSTKVFKVLDVNTRHSFTSTSIKFDEDLFPGLPTSTPNPNLFPYRSPMTPSLPNENESEIDKEHDVDSDPSPPNSPPKKKPRRSMGTNVKKSTQVVADNSQNDRINQSGLSFPESSNNTGLSLPEKSSLSSSTGKPGRARVSQVPTGREELPVHRIAIEVPAPKSLGIHTVHHSAARGTKVSLVGPTSRLAYDDIAWGELPTSMNLELPYSSFLRDTPIPNSSRPTMLIALSHGRKGSGGGAGSPANIRVDINGDPLDFRSAMKQNHTNWYPAVVSEIDAQIKNGSFEITFLPPEKTAIGCRWVFKKKTEVTPVVRGEKKNVRVVDRTRSDPSATSDKKHDDKIPTERCLELLPRETGVKARDSKAGAVYTRYKARLVAKGYEQRYGLDFWATFSPTPRITTFRMLIALAAFFKWDIHQLDVTTAFLNADLDAEVYMEVPDGMETMVKEFLKSNNLKQEDLGNRKVVLRLRKSLYGLKQSPHEWNKDIDGKLKKLGFRQSEADSNLYISTFKNGCFLLLYVDDILLVGPSDGIRNVKSMIMSLYDMKDLGQATLFLGVEIERMPDGRIKLSQSRYIDRMLERFNMTSCNGIQLPLKDDLHASDQDPLTSEEQKDYQSLVGALNWAAVVTRPDISYTLSRLSKFLSKPAKSHKEAAKRTLRYLAGTKNYGLIYGINPADAELFGYTDSNFAADTENRRSTSGFLFMLNGACIHWQSKQQSLVARSTHEAEYVGMATASYEISYLRKLLADISHTPIHDLEPTLLYGDNMGAIATATNIDGDKTARSRHIDIRYHITREALANGTLRLEYIRTTEMTADILTKALPVEVHRRHTANMGLGNG
jgi:Reverse transcriptase (RNA-dependent DNA polymerase)/Integrase core domain